MFSVSLGWVDFRFRQTPENARNCCLQVTDAGNGHPPLTIRRRAGGDTRRGYAEHAMDVLETRVRKIVKSIRR